MIPGAPRQAATAVRALASFCALALPLAALACSADDDEAGASPPPAAASKDAGKDSGPRDAGRRDGGTRDAEIAVGAGASAGCTYDGNAFATGDRFEKGDGCSLCTCELDGHVSCSDERCGLEHCDSDGGSYFTVGDSFVRGCARCSCEPGGAIECVDLGCENLADQCKIGTRDFGDGTPIPCKDGCNECRCDGKTGGWLHTLVGCEPLRPAMPCAEPVPAAAPALSVIYLAGPNDVLYGSTDALALKATFTEACKSFDVELCYGAFRTGDSVQLPVWLRSGEGPQFCSAPGTAELVFDLAPIRRAFARELGEMSGTVTLDLGTSSEPYSF